MEAKPDIHAYGDLAAYLTRYLAWRKERRATFSLRGFARQVGDCSHTMLRHVVAGRRRPGRDLLERLIQAMDLSVDEAAYARVLWQLDHSTKDPESRHPDERRRLAGKLLQASQAGGAMILEVSPDCLPMLEALVAEFQARLLIEAELCKGTRRPYRLDLAFGPLS